MVIWRNRNTFYHGGICGLPNAIAAKSKDLVDEVAEVLSDHGDTRLGMVIRNSEEDVLCSALLRLRKTEDPLLAEILAILYGLHLARARSCRNLIVKSDSLQAINLINQGMLRGKLVLLFLIYWMSLQDVISAFSSTSTGESTWKHIISSLR
ncbi:hypothetical protein CRYUN_Cryun29cG0022700 [Craigia yunnanensis]